jgi:hypothetical protein
MDVYLKMNIKKKKIIASAESFGYGPCALLSSIAAELKNSTDCEVVFAGSGVALQLAKSKGMVFDRTVEIQNLSELETFLKNEMPDEFLSAFSYDAAIVASNLGFKVSLADTLLWHWNWSDIQHLDSKKAKDIFSQIPPDKLPAKLAEFHPQAKHGIAYLLADKAYSQIFPGSTTCKNSTFLNNHSQIDLQHVGPIIEEYDGERGERDTLLISFSGQKNPKVNDERCAQWCRATLAIMKDGLKEFSEQHPDITIHFAGNPDILDVVKKDIDALELKNYSVGHLDRVGWLRAMAHSVAALFPAASGSSYEAIAHETPILYLPEQHHSNFANFISFVGHRDSANGGAFPSACLGTHYPECSGESVSVDRLYEIYSAMLTSEEHPIRKKMSAQFAKDLHEITLDPAKTADDQHKHFLSLCPNGLENGAKVVAADIAKRLSLPITNLGDNQQSGSQRIMSPPEVSSKRSV